MLVAKVNSFNLSCAPTFAPTKNYKYGRPFGATNFCFFGMANIAAFLRRI